jgi:predicted Zn finger-like uncharacterized protein
MRFLVAEGAIGPKGRRVRCANCGHTWKAEAEESLDAVLFDEDSFTETKAVPFSQEEEDADFESILKKQLEEAPIPDGVKPDADDPILAQLIKDREQKEAAAAKAGSSLPGYAAAALFYVLVFGLIMVFQPQISRAWPPSNLFYSLIGLKPAIPGEGLVLEDLNAQIKGGNVSMSGKVLNLKSEDLNVPSILANIVDAKGEIIDRVLIAPPISRIKAEGEASFSAIYEHAPKEAESVNFAFTYLRAKEGSDYNRHPRGDASAAH